MMVLLWFALACGPKHPSTAAAIAPAAAVQESPLMAAPLGLEHPLRGKIWRPVQGDFISEAELLRQLSQVDTVLLGEKHDNPDHHALQAELVRALAPDAVVFEMLDLADPVAGAKDADSLAQVVAWSDSGWPDFAIYRPVFVAAYEVGATVVAGHPTRAQVDLAMKQGLDALPPEVLDGLHLDVQLSVHDREQLAEEIVDAHCGHAPDEMVAMMARAQRLKDLSLTHALEQVEGRAVLVAGTGHTRHNGGVPVYLQGRSVRVVHFQEVDDDASTPAGYPSQASWRQGETAEKIYAPADYVWFTARLDNLDPCERFRKQLEAMRPPE